MTKGLPCICLVAEDYPTMTSRWRGTLYCEGYGRELVSKPAISLMKRWGGGYRRKTLVSKPTISLKNSSWGSYRRKNKNPVAGVTRFLLRTWYTFSESAKNDI